MQTARKSTPKRSKVKLKTASNGKRSVAKRKVVSVLSDHRRAASSVEGPDAITLLERDHVAVRKLLKEIVSSKSAARQTALLEQIETALNEHTQIEEDIFYPAYRDSVQKKEDRQLYYEAVEEHHAVDVILPEVKRAEPGSDVFAGRVKVLKELVEHHADEEESEMFPKARRALGARQLKELGRQIAERKEDNSNPGPLRAVAALLGMG